MRKMIFVKAKGVLSEYHDSFLVKILEDKTSLLEHCSKIIVYELVRPVMIFMTSMISSAHTVAHITKKILN